MMVKLGNNKKYIIFIIILFIFITISIIFVTNLKEENQVLINEKETENYPKKSNNLAIMIETEEDSNKYQEAETFPSNTKYYLNETLSKCTNGNKISYNSETNEVTVKGINADKCYLYFDVIPVFFDVSQRSDTITFARTEAGDFDNILTTETPFELVVKNNDGNMYNREDLEYQVEVINSNKFSLKESSVVTKTLKGGEMIDETVSFNLKIDDLTRTDDKVTIKVTGNNQSYTFDYDIIQEGAIQYIEDLVDMALAIRGTPNPNNLSIEDIQKQRFKMTRDLDFTKEEHYRNPSNTLYGNINLNDKSGTIYEELTSDTGFLPIGEIEHPFQGGFNGGNHTLSNLKIHKALQKNIGMFGTTNGATLKNLTIDNGNVYNENQTAGMLVGKAIGSVIDHITVSGSVESVDTVNTSEDTYTGGIVGYVSEGSTVSYCINRASVKTQFTGDTVNYSGPAGGITAWMSTSTISNCDNYGEVIGQRYIGGITGFSAMQDNLNSTDGYGTVSNCTNHGTVKTYVTTASSTLGYYIGGIVGYNRAHGIIENCTNYEDAVIKGIKNVGGIVGYNPTISGVTGVVKNNTNYSNNISSGANTYGIAGSWTGYSGKVGVDSYGNNNSPRN